MTHKGMTLSTASYASKSIAFSTPDLVSMGIAISPSAPSPIAEIYPTQSGAVLTKLNDTLRSYDETISRATDRAVAQSRSLGANYSRILATPQGIFLETSPGMYQLIDQASLENAVALGLADKTLWRQSPEAKDDCGACGSVGKTRLYQVVSDKDAGLVNAIYECQNCSSLSIAVADAAQIKSNDDDVHCSSCSGTLYGPDNSLRYVSWVPLNVDGEKVVAKKYHCDSCDHETLVTAAGVIAPYRTTQNSHFSGAPLTYAGGMGSVIAVSDGYAGIDMVDLARFDLMGSNGVLPSGAAINNVNLTMLSPHIGEGNSLVYAPRQGENCLTLRIDTKETPSNVIYLTDRSGSTEDIELLIQKMLKYHAGNENLNIGVIGFGTDSEVLLQLTNAGDKNTILETADKVRHMKSATNIYGGLARAYLMAKEAYESNGLPTQIILLSDGMPLGPAPIAADIAEAYNKLGIKLPYASESIDIDSPQFYEKALSLIRSTLPEGANIKLSCLEIGADFNGEVMLALVGQKGEYQKIVDGSDGTSRGSEDDRYLSIFGVTLSHDFIDKAIWTGTDFKLSYTVRTKKGEILSSSNEELGDLVNGLRATINLGDLTGIRAGEQLVIEAKYSYLDFRDGQTHTGAFSTTVKISDPGKVKFNALTYPDYLQRTIAMELERLERLGEESSGLSSPNVIRYKDTVIRLDLLLAGYPTAKKEDSERKKEALIVLDAIRSEAYSLGYEEEDLRTLPGFSDLLVYAGKSVPHPNKVRMDRIIAAHKAQMTSRDASQFSSMAYGMSNMMKSSPITMFTPADKPEDPPSEASKRLRKRATR